MPLPQFQKQEPEDPIQAEATRINEAVKDIPIRVGVHAGKGGVGKTFLATQLAMLLANKGLKVGLIDADVDCPNVPEALGIKADLRVAESGKLIPVTHKKVKIVSTGFMKEEGEPLIIRGPIKHRLLTDFIEKTDWQELDVLVFDFPPGTSDVPLSAMQVASLTGLILVSTPARSSLGDFKRATAMAKKLGVHIYGAIENMSGEVFGKGTLEQTCKDLGIRFITSIPLEKNIRELADEGELALPEEDQEAILSTINH